MLILNKNMKDKDIWSKFQGPIVKNIHEFPFREKVDETKKKELLKIFSKVDTNTK